MMQPAEKPIHWAEAFGLSALFHVGAVYLLLNTVVDLNAVFDPTTPELEELQITSLSIDTGTPASNETGTGGTTLATPETLAPVTPTDTVLDPVAALDPGPEQPEVSDVTQAQAVASVLTPQAVARVASAIAPPPISALRPETQTLAPVGTAPDTAATPVEPDANAQTPDPVPVDPIADVDTADAVETTDAPNPTDLASAPPQPPTAAPAPSQPAQPDPVAADLINRIRASLGETCLIAIPQQTAEGAITLTIYTADENAAAPYADDILADLSPRPDQQTVLIDPRQCAALDYIRQSASYPTSPMTLNLDVARINSGEELTGRLAGTGGRNITLLVVDDNGVTQDLGQYLSVAVNTARFAAPLRRAGAPRDTQQLLIAIGTAARPVAANVQNGQEADDYFTALAAEIGGNAPMVLVPFDVQ